MKRFRFKRKLLAMALVAGLCVSSFAGCGASEDVSQSGAEEDDGSDVQAEESEEEEDDEVISFSLPDAAEEAEIYVEAIPDISDDFIRGMDASAVLAIENSGATYYNFDGEEQDVFMTLAQAGVNYIRLRVWNDPYDEDGNGYGGGNNDVAAAIELGKRATKYGMKVSIDFHYSDFWADPKRQHAPKAWEDMSLEEKCDALYEFTKTSLSEMLEAGVDIGMVQIGNEINNGMAGEYDFDSVKELLAEGSRAVREVSESYDHDIQIAVHYTNIEDVDGIDSIAAALEEYGLDYDMFGLSYYAFWDGTMENMQNVVSSLSEKYGKQVFIAETSYCYTSEDGDGFGNSLVGIDDLVDGYAATVQSQATLIRDIFAAANDAGAMGVFYWEGTWIPVGERDADNSALWEEFGSGWASSYSAEYDPDDAGLYYGGSSWDNQAMFDFDGYPLASLNVFKWLKYGTIAELAVDYIPAVSAVCSIGGTLELPETVDVVYNDRSQNTQVAVTWDAEQIAAIDTNVGGSYEVTGTLEDGTEVTCQVEVQMVNLLANPSFEEDDTSMWSVSYDGDANPTDYQVKADDAYTGDVAFHWYSADSDMSFSIKQEVTGLAAGTYQLSAYAQGGDMSDDAEMELYIVVDGDEVQTVSFMVTTWANWQNPTISDIVIPDGGTVTIGVRIKCPVASWGTVDDFALYRISD